MLKISASDTLLYVDSDTVIPSGSVNTPSFCLSVSDDWDGYMLTVQFKGCTSTVDIADVTPGDEYPIPWECIRESGILKIGLFGICDDKTKTTVPTSVRIPDGCISQGSEPLEPTPSAYQQFVNDIHNDAQAVTDAIGRLENVADVITGAYNEYEHVSNKTDTIGQDSDSESYPTCMAVEQFVSGFVDTRTLESLDPDAEADTSGLASQGAVVSYVNQRTYVPKWHYLDSLDIEQSISKSTNNLDLLNAGRWSTEDGSPDCLTGITAFLVVPAGSTAGALEFRTIGTGNSNIRLFYTGIVSTSATKYGWLRVEQKNGAWTVQFSEPTSNSDDTLAHQLYTVAPDKLTFTDEDISRVKYFNIYDSTGGGIPEGTHIEIWGLW